jgi:hypothetical protein
MKVKCRISCRTVAIIIIIIIIIIYYYCKNISYTILQI